MKIDPKKGQNQTPDPDTDPGAAADEHELEVTGSDEAIADALASIENLHDKKTGTVDNPPAALSSKLDALSSLMQKKDERLKEAHDRLLRLGADFENYKKRVEKDREQFAKRANEALLLGLLPMLDAFERTLQHAETTNDMTAMIEGVRLVHRLALDYLNKQGVKPIEALGKPFNPQYHDAIGQEPAPEATPNHVIKELERGYLLHERLLRPTKVVIAAPPTATVKD